MEGRGVASQHRGQIGVDVDQGQSVADAFGRRVPDILQSLPELEGLGAACGRELSLKNAAESAQSVGGMRSNAPESEVPFTLGGGGP